MTFVAVIPGGSVLSMAMDPYNPNVVYAGGFKTTDGGATWVEQDGGVGFSMAMDPTNSNIVYAGGFGVQKTTDGGETWQFLFKGLAMLRFFR